MANKLPNKKIVLYDMHLNHDLQASAIGVTQNNENRLINLKMLAFNEILPPQLVELNAAVSFLVVCNGCDGPCCSKS